MSIEPFKHYNNYNYSLNKVHQIIKAPVYIYIYMGSGQNTLSRSLYKTTYLIVGVYMVKTTRGVTQLGLLNPLVGARTALGWR